VRAWFVSFLLVCVSCSDRGVRSGSLPEAADFLPMTGDSAEPASEQPRLVLRCEEGRLGAYLVVGTLGEVESGQIGDHAVVVRLDSAPSC
jgi:hypothetical protein